MLDSIGFGCGCRGWEGVEVSNFGVQARPRAGLDCASSRQRSSVPAPMPTSRATTSSGALSGGSNLATALSLNACPYRAKSVLHRRPRGCSMEATTILTRGDTYAVVRIARTLLFITAQQEVK